MEKKLTTTDDTIVDVIVRVKVVSSDAPFYSSLNDSAVSHFNPKEKYYCQ